MGCAVRRKSAVGLALVLPLLLAPLSSCSTAAKNDTFDLSAATSVNTSQNASRRQLLVPDPTALKALDSEQILVRVSPSEIQYLANSQWGDRLPRLVQSKLVEAFENSGRLGGVGKPGQGLAIDFQLVSDIRAFEIETAGGDRAVVEISAKLLNDRNGTIKSQKVFRAVMPARGSQNSAYVVALDGAFGKVSAEIIEWTLANL
ncbi:MAG: ABC-type transport auxiliary lipoprotein family protein [Allorhizobium sp.]